MKSENFLLLQPRGILLFLCAQGDTCNVRSLKNAILELVMKQRHIFLPYSLTLSLTIYSGVISLTSLWKCDCLKPVPSII